mmetsp:Transcript_84413/g.217404  ORF Transcript_84413/g.217404 Transcript_84413/m.217404 type:complete len:235 (+) Transcript_84413:1275-1979(+)
MEVCPTAQVAPSSSRVTARAAKDLVCTQWRSRRPRRTEAPAQTAPSECQRSRRRRGYSGSAIACPAGRAPSTAPSFHSSKSCHLVTWPGRPIKNRESVPAITTTCNMAAPSQLRWLMVQLMHRLFVGAPTRKAATPAAADTTSVMTLQGCCEISSTWWRRTALPWLGSSFCDPATPWVRRWRGNSAVSMSAASSCRPRAAGRLVAAASPARTWSGARHACAAGPRINYSIEWRW